MCTLFLAWMSVAYRDIMYAEHWITHTSLNIFAT